MNFIKRFKRASDIVPPDLSAPYQQPVEDDKIETNAIDRTITIGKDIILFSMISSLAVNMSNCPEEKTGASVVIKFYSLSDKGTALELNRAQYSFNRSAMGKIRDLVETIKNQSPKAKVREMTGSDVAFRKAFFSR